MRAPAVSFAKRFAAAALAALLTFALVPASALAEGESDSPSVGETQDINSDQAEEEAGANAPEAAESDTAVSAPLASVLAGAPTAFVNADVALDGEPVIGSFTVDGLTFAVTEDSNVELVGASEAAEASPRRVVAESQGLSAPLALPDLGSTPAASEAVTATLMLPESVGYNDVEYSVTSIGAYVFYLSGVTSVELPASITVVDDRAFRSSDVASVDVAEGNPNYSSFDGVLYDADQLSLLLIPEGKQGTVLLPTTAESAAPSVFSHCPLVTQIAVEEGSAAFASENGLLYDASLTTLLRVPAGATEITIHDGCTAIAAGAMEACASLVTVNAPASVTSISPDVFTSVPTVSLPAAALAEDAPQLTALVALSSADDDLPEVIPSAIDIVTSAAYVDVQWTAVGISSISLYAGESFAPEAALQSGVLSAVAASYIYFYSNNTEYGKFMVDSVKASGAPISTTEPHDQVSFSTDQGLTISGTSDGSYSFVDGAGNYLRGHVLPLPGYRFIGWAVSSTGEVMPQTSFKFDGGTYSRWAVFKPIEYTIVLDLNAEDATAGFPWPSDITAAYNEDAYLPIAHRDGYYFRGWNTAPDGSGSDYSGYASRLTTVNGATVPLYAQWERAEYDIGFDVDSEPGDADYPGIEKSDEIITGDQIEADEKVEIEDPKRPGYVLQGWVIPREDGTTAIEQDLVYQDETDGKWYVDASKLPDYADDSGRVELTARWTSVISVDVPSAVTFYADVVTEGQESREGAASSAFGQNKVASQSQVDLRIVGLESSAVETQGSTLGADSILKKATSTTPSSSTQKLFSLYPTDEALTADDLQDPDAVSATKPNDAVDFGLDDILLEKAFAADKFTIPAGNTLNLGYRLNLSETGTELNYDKLSTLDEGQSASIANISYCFAAVGPSRYRITWNYNYDGSDSAVTMLLEEGSQIIPPSEPVRTDYGFVGWTTASDNAADNHYVVNFGQANSDVVYYAKWTNEDLWLGNNGTFYPLNTIKAAANDLSAHATSITSSQYYASYLSFLNNRTEFQLRVTNGGSAKYYPVHIIGICQDTKLATSGAVAGKAGLTFAFVHTYNDGFSPSSGATSWGTWSLKTWLEGTFLSRLGSKMRATSTGIEYVTHRQQGASGSLTNSNFDRIFVPSVYEVWGATSQNINPAETSTNCFQYQYFAKGGAAFTASPYRIKTNEGGAAVPWWTRTALKDSTSIFFVAMANGANSFAGTQNNHGIVPCFAL